MIDEAHQILGTKLPSLSRLIRMSRSKGGAVMLVSQSPDDFSGEDDEFLDNMGLGRSLRNQCQARRCSARIRQGSQPDQLANRPVLCAVRQGDQEDPGLVKVQFGNDH
jgi:hypothetical protein